MEQMQSLQDMAGRREQEFVEEMGQSESVNATVVRSCASDSSISLLLKVPEILLQLGRGRA